MRPVRIMFVVVCLVPLSLLVANNAGAQGTDRHSQVWNAFVDKLYALHQQTVAGREIREERRIGGYSRYPEFYEEVKYIDAASGRVLSVIQWERPGEGNWLDALMSLFTDPAPLESRDRLHSIAVNIYDDQGRMVRDYSATYLPDYRGAPTQTLVFLHDYPGELHAMRSFDATGNLKYESCEGSFQGATVDIGLDEDLMADARDQSDGIMQSLPYRACFAGLPQQAGPYLTPQ